MPTDLLGLLLVSALVVGNLGLLATVVILSSLLRSAQRRIGRHERANRMQAAMVRGTSLIEFPDDISEGDVAQFKAAWQAQYGQPAHWRDPDETVQFDVGQVRR